LCEIYTSGIIDIPLRIFIKPNRMSAPTRTSFMVRPFD
jgi:hypothetical protein